MRLLPVGAALLGAVGALALLITLGASLPQLAHPGPWPRVQQLAVPAGVSLPLPVRDRFTASAQHRHRAPAPATSASVPAEPAPTVQPAHWPTVRRTAAPRPTPAPAPAPLPAPTSSPTVIPSPSPTPKLLQRLVTAVPLPLHL